MRSQSQALHNQLYEEWPGNYQRVYHDLLKTQNNCVRRISQGLFGTHINHSSCIEIAFGPLCRQCQYSVNFDRLIWPQAWVTRVESDAMFFSKWGRMWRVCCRWALCWLCSQSFNFVIFCGCWLPRSLYGPCTCRRWGAIQIHMVGLSSPNFVRTSPNSLSNASGILQCRN